MGRIRLEVSFQPTYSATCFDVVIIVVKTGLWGGVVVASVLMSDIKDEIDWEAPGRFPSRLNPIFLFLDKFFALGNSTTSIQSNVYILGIADC